MARTIQLDKCITFHLRELKTDGEEEAKARPRFPNGASDVSDAPGMRNSISPRDFQNDSLFINDNNNNEQFRV